MTELTLDIGVTVVLCFIIVAVTVFAAIVWFTTGRRKDPNPAPGEQALRYLATDLAEKLARKKQS